VAIRVKGIADPLVVFGAGYDDCEDAEDAATACASVIKGKGVYVMGAEKGPTFAYRHIGDGTGLDSSAGRFVADMTPVDVNADGYIDVIYAVDTRGNVWRINTSDPANGFNGYPDGPGGVVAKWQVFKIATVSDWDPAAAVAEKRKFMYAPGVVALGTQVTVLVGTGDREKPLSSSAAAAVKNRFYGFRDKVTEVGTFTAAIGYGAAADLYNVTGQSSVMLPDIEAKKGWVMDLSSTSTPYEQVVTTPLTIGGVTFFNTYQAKANDSTPKSCTNLGTGRGYQIDFQTGIQLPNAANDLEPTVFITPGIPPSPVGGVVSIDGKSKVFCIGCPNPSPIAPKEIIPNVKKNRKPVYRYQRIDG
jgi:type IV pilus assembly protein PilY1